MFLDRMESNPQPSCCEAAAAITAPQEITPLKKTKTFILLECRFCKIPWTIWINKWSLMATFVQINFHQEQKDLNNGKSCLKHRLSRLIMLQTVFESCYLLMERQALLQLFFGIHINSFLSMTRMQADEIASSLTFLSFGLLSLFPLLRSSNLS